MSRRAYAIMHRMHHAYTDTEMDPHSPKYSKNVFLMMWRTKKIFDAIFDGTIKVEERFNRNLPEWSGFDRWAHSLTSRVLWSVLYVALFFWLSSSLWLLLLLPVVMGMGAFQGAIINWFAHKYGYSNFKLKNTSRNLFSVDIFMLGESYHNNHHKRPSAINFGKHWHELDPVYPIILLLRWFHIIRVEVVK
jgi:stearoyl-CoA desaturase (delta-9 desaturase)